MTDALPTTWNAEPHTLVKHAILRRYLQAWLPILTQQSKIVQQQFGFQKFREILFIDGFAGPGEYADKEPGSPVIALEAAIEHSTKFPYPVRMLFIEQRADRFAHLQTVLAPLLRRAHSSQNVRAIEPRHGDCDAVLHEMLNSYDRKKIAFGPALAFLDQFGYGAVSMDLIARLMSYPQCEVLTYLSVKEMNRWISSEDKAPAFTRAFGSEEWRTCSALPEQEQRRQLLEIYKVALREKAAARYIVSFLMFDHDNRPLYWLIFCTNNLRGLEIMKGAMWHADKSGEFRFSDREDPAQLKLLGDCFDQSWLANELKKRLAGRTLTAHEVKEYVLAETPCYLFKQALKSLESDKLARVVAAPVGRRVGRFLDEHLDKITLEFVKSLF